MMNPSISWQFALQLLAIWSRGLTTFEMKLWSHSKNIFHSLKVLEWKEAYSNATYIYLDWTSVPAYDTVMHIVCRTSNRYFVGLPICEYLSSVRLDNFWSNSLLRPRARLSIAQRDLHNQSCYESSDDQLLPEVPPAVCILSFRFLWLMANRFIATYLTTSRSDITRALQYLGPIIESRIAQSKRPKSEQGEMPVCQSSLPYLWPYIDRDDRMIWSAGWLNPQHTKVNLILVRLPSAFWW